MSSTHTRKPRAKLVALPFSSSVALSTLADETIVATTVLGSTFPSRGFYCHSIFTNWGMRGGTVGEGPVDVGYAHDDYSVTEVLEALQSNLVDPSNKIQQERARRLVRKAGIFDGSTEDEVLNDGRPLRTGLGFNVDLGHALEFWARNRSGATLTTGKVLEINGVLYGRWMGR